MPAPAEAPPAVRKRPWTLIAVVIVAIIIIGAVAAYVVLPRRPSPKVVTYAVTSEMVTLDPSTEFSNSVLVLANVYEALALFDPAANEPKPWLATSWQQSTDGLTWTFNLRQGVKFHDGTPFNAAAVKFSIERTWRMQSGAYFIWFPVNWSHPNPVEVVSDFVVRFHLNYSAPMDWVSAADYGAWMFSPNTPGANDTQMADWFNAGRDTGTAPWTIDTAQYTNRRVVLNRFADYWGGWREGQFDHAVITVIADPAQREAAVRDGDVDVTVDVPPADLPALGNNPKVRVDITPSFRTIYAFFNNERSPTSNLTVRKALAHAIPYGDFLSGVLNNLGSQPIGVIPAGMWGHNSTLPKYDFNITKAENLLVQAGYPTKPRFSLTLTYTTGDPFERGFAELYQEKLGTLGITLNIQPMVWEQQWELAKGEPANAQDIFVMYWWPTFITPYDFLWGMFHTSSYRFFNLGYYLNPAFDAKIDEASTLEASDRPRALQLYGEAQLTLFNDVPAVGLVDLKNLYVSKSDLQGLKDNAAYPLVVFFYQLSR